MAFNIYYRISIFVFLFSPRTPLIGLRLNVPRAQVSTFGRQWYPFAFDFYCRLGIGEFFYYLAVFKM